MPYRIKSLARLAAISAVCALLSALVLPAARAAQNQPPPQPSPGTAAFPSLTTDNLAKAKLNLPGDFAAPLDLLLISFQPEQQTQINTWMPLAEALQHTNFNFRWYRVPVSSSENFIFRWWDNASMRSDETDPETYAWIVPLYVNVDSFRRSLQIPTDRQIAIRLVDKQGRVLWSAQGPLTPQKRDSLIAAVAAAK